MSFPILSSILLAPVLGVLLILFIPEKEDKIIKWIAAFATGVAVILSLIAYINYDKTLGGIQYVEHIPWIKALGVNYALGVDGISLPLILLTAIVIFAGVFSSWDMHHRAKEFFIFLLALVAGVFGVFLTTDLFFFYLFFEIAVIPMYILIGVWGSTRKEYAAMKLTLYLLVGSALMLIGIIAIYLYSGLGTFDIFALTNIKYDVAFQKFAFFLMLIGFGFLVPMWPLHTWSPDGHVAAPTAVSMLHAGVLMKLGGYGLIRVGIFMFPQGAEFWSPLLAVLCIVNVVYGAFAAMAQKDLKFVIGYSSVSHMGYVLLGIASLNTLSINGAVGQMFAHGIMTALFFSIIGNIYHKAHTRKISDFGGLAHQMPRASVGFLIAGLASLGLPGLINFVAEYSVFVGSFRVYTALAVLAVSGIVITACYVLRVYRDVFNGPRNPKWDSLEDIKGIELFPIIILCGVLLFFGIFPSLLMDMINNGVDPFVQTYLSGISIGGML